MSWTLPRVISLSSETIYFMVFDTHVLCNLLALGFLSKKEETIREVFSFLFSKSHSTSVFKCLKSVLVRARRRCVSRFRLVIFRIVRIDKPWFEVRRRIRSVAFQLLIKNEAEKFNSECFCEVSDSVLRCIVCLRRLFNLRRISDDVN